MKDVFNLIDTGKIREAIELVKDKSFNPNIKGPKGVSPLHYSAEKVYREIVTILQEKINEELYKGAHKGDIEKVKLLLEAGANPNMKDQNNNSPLL